MSEYNLLGVEIFVFSGKMGSGKDFLAKVLHSMLPPKPTIFLSLADTMKIEGIVKGGLDREKVYGKKDEKTRLVLQKIGTEEGRVKFGYDIWIKFLYEWMLQHQQRGIQRFFITDMRFKNEYTFFQNLHATIFRVIAPKRNFQCLLQEANSSDDNQVLSEQEKQQKLDIMQNHVSEHDLDMIDKTKVDNVVYIYNDPEENGIDQIRDYANSIYPPPLMIPSILSKKLIGGRSLPKVTFMVDLDGTIVDSDPVYHGVMNQVAVKYGIDPNIFYEKQSNRLISWDISNVTDKVRLNELYPESEKFYRDGFAMRLIETVKYFIPNLEEQECNDIYKKGMSVYTEKFPLLEGAFETLNEMKKHGSIVILTIGERSDQLRKIYMNGLQNICPNVETTYLKDESFYLMMKTKYPSENYVMMGDSLIKDIVPSTKAGIHYVYYINKDKFKSIKIAFEHFLNK